MEHPTHPATPSHASQYHSQEREQRASSQSPTENVTFDNTVYYNDPGHYKVTINTPSPDYVLRHVTTNAHTWTPLAPTSPPPGSLLHVTGDHTYAVPLPSMKTGRTTKRRLSLTSPPLIMTLLHDGSLSPTITLQYEDTAHTKVFITDMLPVPTNRIPLPLPHPWLGPNPHYQQSPEYFKPNTPHWANLSTTSLRLKYQTGSNYPTHPSPRFLYP